MQHLAIIGHFGGKEKFCDGQTLKTLALFQALNDTALFKIHKVDTYYNKTNKWKLFCDTLSGLFMCRKVIVLVSKNGMKMYFPLLYWSHKILRTQVFHYVIGGTLASEVQAHPKWKKYISAFEGNWVESRLVVEKLRAQGVNNACYVPNFKQLSPLREEELSPVHTPMRFCTFSRVMKEKGISDAINALATVNREETVATLTVYGPVAKEYEEEFGALCKRYASFCTYGGVIDAEKSVSVLKNYDLLLFPTYWYGEGMPGTMIDAFCAGLPIVARWWPYCDEMITHLQTGFVYPFDRPEQLEQWVRYALSHPQEVYAMKKACLAAGASYTQACVLPQILALLQEKK